MINKESADEYNRFHMICEMIINLDLDKVEEIINSDEAKALSLQDHGSDALQSILAAQTGVVTRLRSAKKCMTFHFKEFDKHSKAFQASKSKDG